MNHLLRLVLLLPVVLSFSSGIVRALTTIQSEADWIALEGVANDDLALTADIVFSSTPAPIDLGEHSFDGNHHTVRLPAGSFGGLFNLRGGSIRELNVDLAGATLAEGAGAIVAGSEEGGANYGRIVRCSVMGASPIETSGSGGIVGGNFGRANSLIESCVSSLDIGTAPTVGGIAGEHFLGTIRSSQMLGSLLAGAKTSGGLLASSRIQEGGTRIEDCVMSGDVLGEACGGIVGEGTDVTILRSTMVGSVSPQRNNGSLIGKWLGYTDGDFDLIVSSYAVSNAENPAPLIGLLDHTFVSIRLSIRDTYLAHGAAPLVGVLNGSGVIGGGTLVLENVYGGNAVAGSMTPDWLVDDAGGYEAGTPALVGGVGDGWDLREWVANPVGLPMLRSLGAAPWVGYLSHAQPPLLPPQLSIQVGGGAATLSWPSFWADWTPEECGGIGNNAWQAITTSVQGDTTMTVSTSVAGKAQCFYRLSK